MYYNPSNKFFTHLYHNSRHNCLKKCSVFFCAMVKKLFGLGLGVGRRIETEAAQSRLLGAARVRLAGSGGIHFGSADRSCYKEEPRGISVGLVQRFGSYGLLRFDRGCDSLQCRNECRRRTVARRNTEMVANCSD